ncbi:hypothetical protein TVAG_288950 [Trichomonas vaginalis G3]|uniref:Uncharacterized protein n=1 Tax=Trichomonas vaginalis (strain ATCC PRA-98 / G3) TaxID=412133 RepID=A2ERF0_TRIV3|nr:nerve growth factor signaling pathway [Trichomonas vaginalis G3]EAY04753.1 hypothetical protein TVAG_288950 [Trichomonas vaginalis G3]KAI5545877.1 nerve growth factor signaling pathway [Trichomonas vaginalis G3]|eukprot:XP_001316976.1 hypothetical protein [Trichomonas vaginalis G3]
MSQGLVQNYTYIAAHFKEYIDEDKALDIFELEDIGKILNEAMLSPNDFNKLLQQLSSKFSAIQIYKYTRNATIPINSLQDSISTLKSIQKYMKLRLIDGVIDHMNYIQNEMSNYTKKLEKFQSELNMVQTQNQNYEKEIQSLKYQIEDKKREISEIKDENDIPKVILSKITELKNSDDFESIYNFVDGLSGIGNQKMMEKAYEEGLWQKINKKL